jgi:chromosome segregation ATPase
MPNAYPSESNRNNENALRRSLRDLMRGNGTEETPEEPAPSRRAPEPDDLEGSALRRAGILRDTPPPDDDLPPSREAPRPKNNSELQRLEGENEQLRGQITELRQKLDEAAEKGQGSFEERERSYESMLEDKSEEIRGLYIRIQELKEAIGSKGGGGPVRDEAADEDADLQAMAEDLERERMQLEEERQRLEEETRQIREDEEELMHRMREMELQTAKGRADLARQHNELHQLHNEVRRELEQAQQMGANTERVRSIQKAHQEVSLRKR